MRPATAYFVMAHQRPEQLRWLVQALLERPGGESDLLLLHVDRKSMLGLRRERRGMKGSLQQRLSLPERLVADNGRRLGAARGDL